MGTPAQRRRAAALLTALVLLSESCLLASAVPAPNNPQSSLDMAEAGPSGSPTSPTGPAAGALVVPPVSTSLLQTGARARTESIALSLFAFGLIVGGVETALAIGKVAVREYTKHEISVDARVDLEAHVRFCEKMRASYLNSQLQMKLADLMMTWAQDGVREKAHAPLDLLLRRVKVTMEIMRHRKQVAAWQQATAACGHFIGDGPNYNLDYEAALKDPKLDLSYNTIGAILKIAGMGAKVSGSDIGKSVVHGLSKLKKIVYYWHSEAFAQMVAFNVARDVAYDVLKANIPPLYVALTSAETAYDVASFVAGLSGYWEKVLQSHSERKRNELNYQYVMCTALWRGSQAELLRASFSDDLLAHLDGLTDADIPPLPEPTLPRVDQAEEAVVGVVRAAATQAEVAEVAAEPAPFHNAKVQLKEVCSFVEFHGSVFAGTIHGGVIEMCRTLVQTLADEIDVQTLHDIYARLNADSNDYATAAFPAQCPHMARVIASQQLVPTVKHLFTVPRSMIDTNRSLMTSIFEHLDREQGVVTVDPTTQISVTAAPQRTAPEVLAGYLDPTKDLRLPAITDVFPVPIKRDWVLNYLSRTPGQKKGPKMAIRLADLAKAIDTKRFRLGSEGRTLEGLLDPQGRFQPAGLPCVVSRYAGDTPEFRRSFAEEFSAHYYSALFGESKRAPTKYYPEEYRRSEAEVGLRDTDTCFAVLYNTEDGFFSKMEPYVLFVERNNWTAPMVAMYQSDHEVEGAPSWIYVSPLGGEQRLYLKKFDSVRAERPRPKPRRLARPSRRKSNTFRRRRWGEE